MPAALLDSDPFRRSTSQAVPERVKATESASLLDEGPSTRTGLSRKPALSKRWQRPGLFKSQNEALSHGRGAGVSERNRWLFWVPGRSGQIAKWLVPWLQTSKRKVASPCSVGFTRATTESDSWTIKFPPALSSLSSACEGPA